MSLDDTLPVVDDLIAEMHEKVVNGLIAWTLYEHPLRGFSNENEWLTA